MNWLHREDGSEQNEAVRGCFATRCATAGSGAASGCGERVEEAVRGAIRRALMALEAGRVDLALVELRKGLMGG